MSLFPYAYMTITVTFDHFGDAFCHTPKEFIDFYLHGKPGR